MELSALAAHEAYGDDFIPGAGMITGIGKVAGRECMIVVNDPTVKGGSYYPLTVSYHAILHSQTLIVLFLGQEASPRTRDCSGASIALRLSW